jgi:hypothetical protein
MHNHLNLLYSVLYEVAIATRSYTSDYINICTANLWAQVSRESALDDVELNNTLALYIEGWCNTFLINAKDLKCVA